MPTSGTRPLSRRTGGTPGSRARRRSACRRRPGGRRRPRRTARPAAAGARPARTAGPSSGGCACPGCRRARCSRRTWPRTGAPSIVADAADQAVGRRALDQLLACRGAAPGRRTSAARTRRRCPASTQVGDVLARGAARCSSRRLATASGRRVVEAQRVALADRRRRSARVRRRAPSPCCGGRAAGRRRRRRLGDRPAAVPRRRSRRSRPRAGATTPSRSATHLVLHLHRLEHDDGVPARTGSPRPPDVRRPRSRQTAPADCMAAKSICSRSMSSAEPELLWEPSEEQVRAGDDDALHASGWSASAGLTFDDYAGAVAAGRSTTSTVLGGDHRVLRRAFSIGGQSGCWATARCPARSGSRERSSTTPSTSSGASDDDEVAIRHASEVRRARRRGRGASCAPRRRAMAGGLRALGVGRGRPRRGLHAEHPGDGGSVSGLRLDRRGVVIGGAGVRRPQRDRPLRADRAEGAAGDRRLPVRRQGLRPRARSCGGSPARSRRSSASVRLGYLDGSGWEDGRSLAGIGDASSNSRSSQFDHPLWVLY